jgi:hypothetical protein
MDARIWLTGAAGEPRSISLAGERTVIGRDPAADLSIEDEAVSGAVAVGEEAVWVANNGDGTVTRIEP